MMKNIHAQSSQIRLTKAKYDYQENWEGVNAKVPTQAAGYDTDEEKGAANPGGSMRKGGVVFKNTSGRPAAAVMSPADIIAAASG